MTLLYREGWGTVVCVGSGPSFDDQQVAALERAHREGRCRLIVTNNNWERLPGADLLYGCDGLWWDKYFPKIDPIFKGERWTATREAADAYGLKFIEVDSVLPGIADRADKIPGGGNSGYQAVNLAYLFGAQTILLVGFDFQATNGMTHWFGDHPSGLWNNHPYANWIRRFGELVVDLEARGIRTINCTKATALDCLPRSTLEKELYHDVVEGDEWDGGQHPPEGISERVETA